MVGSPPGRIDAYAADNVARNGPYGALSRNVTVWSAVTSTASTGANWLAQGEAFASSLIRSTLYFTSSAVSELPLWKVTFGRKVKMNVRSSGFSHDSASSGCASPFSSKYTSRSYTTEINSKLDAAVTMAGSNPTASWPLPITSSPVCDSAPSCARIVLGAAPVSITAVEPPANFTNERRFSETVIYYLPLTHCLDTCPTHSGRPRVCHSLKLPRRIAWTRVQIHRDRPCVCHLSRFSPRIAGRNLG